MPTTQPIVKLADSGPARESGLAASHVLGLDLAGPAACFSDRLEVTDVELLRALHLRLYIADRAARRARHGFGRILNGLTGEAPDYIPVPGPQLQRLLEIAGRPAPRSIPLGMSFLLRTDIAREAYRRLTAAYNVPAAA